MKIGKYTVTSLETGRFYLDGGAMFGVVPKVLWNRSNHADERNRIELALRVLLIRDEKRCIIVDTGIGEGWDPKFSDIYGIDHSKYTLLKSLSDFGLAPEDVTDVIITHLHFDHVGGATIIDQQGRVRPAFPGATYFVQKKHYDWATIPTEKDQASFVSGRFVPLHKEGKLKFLEGEVELYPKIFIKLSDGHTIAQQNVLITSDKVSLCHPGDMIPTSAHVALPYIMGYDNNPLTTLKEKKSVLQNAVDQNWILFFEHDPVTSATRVVRTENGFKPGDALHINGE